MICTLHIIDIFVPALYIYIIYQNTSINFKTSKGYDNRCLKPDDHKDPEEWDHYDPDDFYDAVTQEYSLFNLKSAL